MNNNLIYDMIKLDDDNILMNNCITHINYNNNKNNNNVINIYQNGVLIVEVNLSRKTVNVITDSDISNLIHHVLQLIVYITN